jgi:regulator of sigma E protease
LNAVSSITTDVIVVAIVLGFLIFIHELGHFLAAKHFGVRAPVFSIGFGKRLWGFKRGGTDYRISLLPFGGYVRMAGEDPSEPHSSDPGNLLAHPRWQRFIIAFAGPAMNILAALLLLTILYRFHYQKPAYATRVARIGEVAPDSPGAKAGLKPGDVIVRMSNRERPTWNNISTDVLMSPKHPIPLQVLRHGKLLDVSLVPEAARDGAGYAGIGPCTPAVLDSVEAGSPAKRAGLDAGDRIVAVNGQKTPCFDQFYAAVQASGGKPLEVTVDRHGRDIRVPVQPVRQKVTGESRWIIGVEVRMIVVQRLPLGKAIASSFEKNVNWTVLTYVVLKRVITHRMPARELAGPVGIAQMSGEAYRLGLSDLIAFVAYISLDLAIVNLLPIPILDGGVILFLFIESVMQRDLSLQFKEKLVQIAMFLILLAFVFITYNDVIRALGHY